MGGGEFTVTWQGQAGRLWETRRAGRLAVLALGAGEK
jgi:hypothetical protein